jgi:hypothetical protein
VGELGQRRSPIPPMRQGTVCLDGEYLQANGPDLSAMKRRPGAPQGCRKTERNASFSPAQLATGEQSGHNSARNKSHKAAANQGFCSLNKAGLYLWLETVLMATSYSRLVVRAESLATFILNTSALAHFAIRARSVAILSGGSMTKLYPAFVF